MSNLFKKVTSAVAGLAVVFSIVSPIAGVNAVYSSSLEAANKLASVGVINDNSANPADYRLGDTITRREVMKVAMNLASCQNIVLNSTYAGKFSDVPASDWAWKYAETAVDNALIAANATFAPARNVTKGESLKMVMNVTQIEKATGGANFWADYVQAGVDAGIVESFSDYDTTATRGWIFKVAANALETGSCGADTTDNGDDLLGDLLGDIDGTDTGATDDTTDTGSTVSGEGVLTVSLSADTPEAATVPAAVKGLPVAAYDFTAGSEDVTVTSITVKRAGLSDKDTLTSIAAFTADGRVSKGKNDSLNNDTEAQLTLTNGLVVKAGETVTVWIVADVNNLAPDSGTDGTADAYDEFAVSLVEITASANVETDGSLVGNTMKVGSVEAASLEIKDGGSVSNPKLGEEGIEVFKFNAVGASGTDIVMKSITFKADGDASDDLANFKLWKGTTEIASTAEMNDKYLTFNLGDGFTVAENKTEKFIVTADVVSGAGDTISFYVYKTLDVTAIDTKYGYGSNIVINIDADTAGDLGPITVQAGELTLVDIDATSDKIKEDKDDVVLGKIKVTNVAGKDLELQQFGIKVDLTVGTATTAGPVAATLANVLENFELYNEDTGASYELTQGAATNSGGHDVAVFSDTDLGISLAQGSVTFALRADTKNNITNFDTAKFDLSLATGTLASHPTTGAFYVEETEDDTAVSDITPSSLTWNQLDGVESSATLSLTPLADIVRVRGSADVVALQFEIEADEASAISIDEIKATVNSGNDMDWDGTANGVDLDTDWDGTANAADTDDDNDGIADAAPDTTPTGPAAAGLANNSQIAAVALYKGTVADANKLDQVSGSSLSSGVATFNGFDVAIAANAKQTFVVTVSFVDGIDATVNGRYNVSINTANVSAEDEDSDDVAVWGGTLTSARDVTVTTFGTLVATQDSNNDDNKEPKTILAGTTKKVFSVDVQAQNESVDVDTVVFNLTATATLPGSVVNASLYLGDTLIATNSNSDITTTTITFKDLSTLIIPQETKELKLALNTANIGYQQVGHTVLLKDINSVDFKNMKGVDSGKDLADILAQTVDTSSNDFSIVPVVVTPSVSSNMSTGQAKLKITVDAGSNTVDGNNSAPSILITDLVFSQIGNTAEANAFKIYKEGNSARFAYITSAGVLDNGTPLTPMVDADLTISSSETYVIVPKGTVDTTYTLNLTKTGIEYDAVDSAGNIIDAWVATALTSNLSTELELGTKSY